jgi:hypothetical protein
MIALKMQAKLKNKGALKSKAPLFYFLLLLFIFSFFNSSYAQVNPRCLTTQYDSLLKIKFPSLQKNRQTLNYLVTQRQHFNDNIARKNTIEEETIIIPVVVHVIHNTSSRAVGGSTNGNISNEQILSQIAVLNEDFRRKEGTNGFNTDPAGADMNIEFKLATLDPNGRATDGITRTYHENASFDIDTDDDLLKSLIYWPSNRYMNIWVTSLKNKYLGYAQFPVAETLEGLPDLGKLAKTDGVVINHTNFGRKDDTYSGTVTSNVYGKGRTTTHEVAHWLGLLHTWGDENCGDDYCMDTPVAEGPNNSVYCQELFSTCTGSTTRNMVENFLDYSPDECMNIFTQDQKDRIRNVLQVSQQRAALIRASSQAFQTGLKAIKVYKNPAKEKATLDIDFNNLSGVTIQVVSIMGKIINNVPYQLENKTLELDVRNLPDGLYLIYVISEKETRTAKLMVAN